MKWDMKTDPPTAWELEDGEWVTVNPNYVFKCSVCAKWYVQNPLNEQKINTCSIGCRLKRAEKNEKADTFYNQKPRNA